ncbi:3-deoxy-D-manno-octulosonate 8-phosphate phosphatase (KDO 8-P phosphatase) [Fluviicoccus keumensis]|uniref:3-deoxy-D-manno-octulosonate 8-phosphate phosphatase KdsC n=1 Tax=Fluviicoccus keumensis TaxID=1435465 RepID=A0A4Q7Z681_9GAMM|nr:3-deoxy-manno-octulosonate-8-phosphatase KdsC [Fluviicoccus keumensis]RZU45159.1 3-deoxy-D-manno-octulosonate 8-phosphate phosphatase (KDO 8-P phosphatase) [Fluviicoccus keumensis]
MLSVRITEKARHVRLLALDVDGVLTDGRLYFTEDGQEIKTFDTQDGHGIKLLQQAGVQCAIITGRTTRLVERRAGNLGITLLLQGREDKLVALRELSAQLDIPLDEMAYVGDDWPDLPAIRAAGLGVAVANAHREVRRYADFVTLAGGGRGAVREICDLILEAQGRYEEALAPYLE